MELSEQEKDEVNRIILDYEFSSQSYQKARDANEQLTVLLSDLTPDEYARDLTKLQRVWIVRISQRMMQGQ